MKIGIIGSGRIGANAARLLTRAGHDVILSNSRGAASLEDLVRELGPHASAAENANSAARDADVVLLAAPWRATSALPDATFVRGKVVIDAMNPYRDDGGLYDLGDSTSSEETAKRLPGARVVKAFNTIYYVHLANQGDASKPVDDRRAIPIAGDDADAKAVVTRLIEDMGFAAVDTGSLRDGGRKQQPGTSLYNRDLTARDARALL